MTSFNLIHDPWIPVTAGGASTEVSLLDALTRAHEIDSLSLAEPLQTVAVLRQVLLPVLLDAVGAPRSERDWAEAWRSPRLDAPRIADYLHTHSDRFGLFDSKAPFAQVAGLHTARNETKSVGILLPAVASGNNVPLFSVRTDADPPPLRPAEAARALLAAHCWDTAAIKSGAVGDPQVRAGKTTGNPTGPVGSLGVVLPMGPTLAATLLLNLPILRQGLRPQDRPQWRSEPATAQWLKRPALGLMDLLTFQSRRVLLIPTTSASGVTTVSRVVLAAGDRLEHQPEFEIHTMWRQEKNPKAGVAARRPERHQPGKAAWRGLSSLLATSAPTEGGVSSSLLLQQAADLREEGYVPDDLPLQVLTVGVAYGNKSATVEDVLVDLIPLPVLALASDNPVRSFLHQVVTDAEVLRRASNNLGGGLRLAAGGERLPWDKGLHLGDALIAQLSQPVHRLLAGLQRHPELLDDAEAAWRDTARRLALDAGEEALASAPPQTFLGREEPGTNRVYRQATVEAHYRAAVYSTLPRTPDPAPTGVPE